jgi:hypothetical protein
MPQIIHTKTQPLATSDVVQCILLWCGRLLSDVVLLTPLEFAKCFCSSDSFTCLTHIEQQCATCVALLLCDLCVCSM